MIYLIFGLVFLALFLMAGRALTKVPAAKIAQHAKFGGIAVLGLLALMLVLTGRFGAVSSVLALAGRAMSNNYGFNKPTGFDDVDGPASRPGAHQEGPAIRTRYLEMHLDEGLGTINGRFVAGPYAGSDLKTIGQQNLIGALDGMRDDGESVRLLEAYLDRTFAGWREHHNQGTGRGSASAADSSGMGKDEAYEILGLEPGCDADAIRSAHRRLMANIHPDRGGSTYLAAKVNLAKEVLLKLHG